MKKATGWRIEQLNPGHDGGVFYELMFISDDPEGQKIADALFETMMQNGRHAKFRMIKSEYGETQG